MRRKKKKLSQTWVTLFTGLSICLVLACLQDDLHGLLQRIKNVDQVQVEWGEGPLPIVIEDSSVINKLLFSLKMAKKFKPDIDKQHRTSETIQIYFYSNRTRFNVTLLKNYYYGYFIDVNDNCYISEPFSSMILSLHEYVNTKGKIRQL